MIRGQWHASYTAVSLTVFTMHCVSEHCWNETYFAVTTINRKNYSNKAYKFKFTSLKSTYRLWPRNTVKRKTLKQDR